MENNRFFKWLWRINAIGLFLLLVAGLYSFVDEKIEQDREENREPITSIATDPQGVEKWELGYAMEVYGSPYTIVPLISKYNKVESLQDEYSTINNVEQYRGHLAKNILFFDTKNNSSSWLFPHNNQLIVEYYMLLSSEKDHKAKLLYYRVIDKDTNGDKIATQEDKQSVALSDVSGKNYKVIVEAIDRVISSRIVENKALHLIYQKDGVGHALKFDIEKFEIVSDVLLPKVGE